MASNRHLGRIIVLQSLYEIAFRSLCEDKTLDNDDVVARNISRYKAAAGDADFIKEFVSGVLSKASELDETIQPLASEWPLDQISRIDHNLLRMGAYELLYHPEIPPKVVINEAVELAKAFGSENSSKFINGVMGTLLKSVNPEAAKADEASAPGKEENNEKPEAD